MLYIKDNIIKDSSLITLTINDKIVYNPSQELLEENGWSVYNESNLNQFINKRYIETTNSVFNNVDKSDLKDTIVFIKDVSKIYLNGNEYHCGFSELSDYRTNYGFGMAYTGKICINNNWYELSIPCAGYYDYSDKGWGTTNIGQFISNNGGGYNVNIPNSTYEDFIGEEKSVHIGDFQFAGNTYPVYTPKVEMPKIDYIEQISLKDINNTTFKPGKKYEIIDYKTTIDNSIGDVVYKEGEQHHIITEALNETTLSHDAKSITFIEQKPITIEPTGDFELIAYKCDWDPDNECYGEDGEYYKYVGDTIVIDDTTYYVWHKFENGVRLYKGNGKATIITTSLDFECSINNPYHIEYFINYDDEVKGDYGFQDPEETGEHKISDSISRIVRIDKPVYNYHIKMQACDMDPNTGEYGLDDISWYEYNGDTIDIDGVTYFRWNKYCEDTGSGDICHVSCGLPITTSLDIKCSPEKPYTPEMWITVDNELNNEYFDPEKTDIFYQIEFSNLPEVPEVKPIIIETDVKFDPTMLVNFDESQVVNALAFKTRATPDSEGFVDPIVSKEVDYESMHLYSGDTFELDGKTYYIWDKWIPTEGSELVNGQYALDEYGLNPQMLLTDKLYIDCSVDKPYNADYSLTQEGEVTENYQLNHFGDSFVEIKYFNNVTNYIRFVSNGWYVRCPELDQDGKFGWAYISNTVNGYTWTEGGGNEYGPFPAFMNTYNLDEPDFFLTDTLDPQVGDNFYNPELDESDIIDKVWGTIIEPEISCNGIYHMKDEFGNEAPYDFKHIKFNDLYTFGNEDEDYSLNGFENGVYNNIIMKPTNSNYNRISISSKNVYGNTIYPSVTSCVIDFSVKESLITKSELGLHVFDPTSFITPISVKPLVGQNQIISYTTTDEQIVNPKSDAFGDATIISNKYE